MKKAVATITVIVMLVFAGITAFAADGSETNDGSKSTGITVNGKRKDGAPSADVISVDIVWDEMNFTYTPSSKGTWNPKTHEYEGKTAGSWTWDSASEEKSLPEIVLTNHSDTAINASFEFNSDIDKISGEFSEGTLIEIATAENTLPQNAPECTNAFSVKGGEIDSETKLGTITVTVTKSGTSPAEPQTTVVTSKEELLAALPSGGKIVLANDINLETEVLKFTDMKVPTVIDLGGHTLSCDSYSPAASVTNSTVSITNGTFLNTLGEAVTNISGTVSVENCTLIAADGGDSYVFTNSGKTLIKNSVLKGKSPTHNSIYTMPNSEMKDFSELTFSGIVQTDGYLQTAYNPDLDPAPTVKILTGVYTFDPTDFVDTNAYTVVAVNTVWVVYEK